MRLAGLAVAVIAAMGLMAFAPGASDSSMLEYQVKAAYLSKFGIFIDWPKTTFDTPQSPVVLCLVGADPFGDTLDKIVQGQHIGNRPVVIRRLKAVARDSGCTILYAGGSDEQSVDQALAAVNGLGVLTVTDSVPDSHAPGIVEFVVQDNRVRFNIDDQAAAKNGITISSHLLSLALNVRPRN